MLQINHERLDELRKEPCPRPAGCGAPPGSMCRDGWGDMKDAVHQARAELTTKREERAKNDALEEKLEAAYWAFDTNKKHMSERDAFKAQVRMLLKETK